MKRARDPSGSQAQPGKRSPRPGGEPAHRPSLDRLVRSLADGSDQSIPPPVWSSHNNLIAVALPSPPQAAPVPFFSGVNDIFASLPSPPRLVVLLTHLAGVGAAQPRVSTRLEVPLPPTFPADAARISHLSWAPDGSQLLVVASVKSDSNVDDLVTVFEQRSSCVDDWACVVQESVGRFGGIRSALGTSGKKVMAIRWVGEPRRWYPAPTFPDAREQQKRPLYCAPPRSAPLSGTAFVVVLSSEEILFVHLPNASTAPTPPGASSVLPSVVCLPLRPAPVAAPSSTPESSSPRPSKGLTLPAIPTPPTPLPLAPSLSTTLFPAAATGGPTNTVDTPTPQATIDALVTSLIPTLPSAAALPVAAASATMHTGPGGKSALQNELRLASSTGGAGLGATDRDGASETAWRAQRRVRKAAVGACRSRGGKAETVFVVACCTAAVLGTSTDSRASAASRRASRAKQGQDDAAEEKPAEEENTKKADKPTDTSNGFDDDDFSMLADFTSLDEAFGCAPDPPAAAPATAVDLAKESDMAEEQEFVRAETEGWAKSFEREDLDVTEGKWRVELAEVKIEMAAMDGPRITVTPQPPLYLNPTPASSTGSSTPDTADVASDPISDPILTHLTFLGDVSLPHPLQLTSHSPSLASDGSEAAVDLCLLAVTAQRSASHTDSWHSTLSSYALSREDAYPLSEAFHTLEGRKFDAPTVVEGEGPTWAARHVTSKKVGKDGNGTLSAVEIRPGGGEWGSVVGLVAEPVEDAAQERSERWRTKVLRLNSVSLDPLDKAADSEEDDESAALILPGSQLFSALTTSPNGALLCAVPYSPASSTSPAPQPVLAASPLGKPEEQVRSLATRLAIGLARQGDVGDLVGRIKGLKDVDVTLAVVRDAHDILRKMVPTEAQLDSSALGLELLGVTSSLFRDASGLEDRAEAAERMLELAACARALKRAERKERGALAGAWKPDLDAVWPVVGHCVWFCSTFLHAVLTAALASPTAPALLIFLHPLFRALLNTVTSTLQHLNAYLMIEGVSSEAMDLAKGVVEEALAGAAGGKGLVEWAKVLAQISGELGGGPAASTTPHDLLASLAIPPALEAQAIAVRNILLAGFPGLHRQDGAPPTPPQTPLPSEWDSVRRARLPTHTQEQPTLQERSCLRCGRRTRAFDEPVTVPVIVGMGPGEGRWMQFEAEWEGRCVCGGMWTRTTNIP